MLWHIQMLLSRSEIYYLLLQFELISWFKADSTKGDVKCTQFHNGSIMHSSIENPQKTAKTNNCETALEMVWEKQSTKKANFRLSNGGGGGGEVYGALKTMNAMDIWKVMPVRYEQFLVANKHRYISTIRPKTYTCLPIGPKLIVNYCAYMFTTAKIRRDLRERKITIQKPISCFDSGIFRLTKIRLTYFNFHARP